MKKLIIAGFVVIFVLAIAIQPTNAQDGAMQFGVKGGLNLSNLSLDPDPSGLSLDLATNFGVGGIMLYPLSDVLDLQVEVLYLLKGSKLKFDLLGETFEGDINYAYLSVPVMGRYKLGSGDADMTPYVVAGPEFGFLLSADSEFAGISEDTKDVTKSIDLGFNVGVGMTMNNMFGEVRYSLGLIDINDDADDPDTSIKTNGIQAFVGMMF